jgi:methylase of polypeptide subunit release factors
MPSPRIMVCGAFSSLMSGKAGGGYSFADHVRSRYLRVMALLEENGFVVLSAHRADQFGEAEWIADFMERDLAWVEDCDVQLVMLPADERGEAYRTDGTMIEMGYALARGKPLIVLADDPDSEQNSFFLRSFVSRKSSKVVAWSGDFEDTLIEALRAQNASLVGTRNREQRTDVDQMIEDLKREEEPHKVHVAGLDIVVLPGVLSPRLSHAPDALMARWNIPNSARVLDIGCGSGVLGLAALTQGASQIVALDINEAAVKTAQLNLKNLGLSNRGEARHSDAYSALKRGEVFDVIIFAAPYWDREAHDDLEKSCFDSDYIFFGKAVGEAHRWLTPDGSMYIIFSDQGDLNKALKLINESQMMIENTHLMRPTQQGGHIRIIWELKRRDASQKRLLGIDFSRPRPLAG